LKELISDQKKYNWEQVKVEEGVTIFKLQGGSAAPTMLLNFTGKEQYEFGDVTKGVFKKLGGLFGGGGAKQPEQPKKESPDLLNKSAIYVMRGDVTIDCSPQVFVDALADLDNRAQWDKLFLSRTLVKMIQDEGNGNRTFLSQMKFKSAGIGVSPRDFATLTGARFDKDTGKAIVFSKSIEDKRIPPSKDFVRGELLTSGYIIEAANKEQTKTKVCYIVQLDPKGSVPNPIAAMVSKQQPLTLARLYSWIVATKLNKS